MSSAPEDGQSNLSYANIANAKDADQFELKEEYFDLLERIQKLTDDSGDSGVPINNLNQVVQRADAIFKKVVRPNEAKLDAEVLKHVGALGKVVIEKTQSSFVQFTPSDFADKIITFIGEDGDNCLLADAWLVLGTFTETFYKTAEGLIPLYGALEWQRPERVARERQARTQDEAIVLRKTNEQESSTRSSNDMGDVHRIYKSLRAAFKENGNKSILLLRFILDPDSFSTTIHNMFHLSFLIRDGFVHTILGDHKLIHLVPVTKTQKESEPDTGITSQAIFDLDYYTYQEVKKLLKIRQPMIPALKRPNQDQGDD